MKIDPVPLEKLLRAETLTRQLHTFSRKELEDYTAQLILVTVKLTHHAQSLAKIVHEAELGLKPLG